jgi:hypothetical protein
MIRWPGYGGIRGIVRVGIIPLGAMGIMAGIAGIGGVFEKRRELGTGIIPYIAQIVFRVTMSRVWGVGTENTGGGRTLRGGISAKGLGKVVVRHLHDGAQLVMAGKTNIIGLKIRWPCYGGVEIFATETKGGWIPVDGNGFTPQQHPMLLMAMDAIPPTVSRQGHTLTANANLRASVRRIRVRTCFKRCGRKAGKQKETDQDIDIFVHKFPSPGKRSISRTDQNMHFASGALLENKSYPGQPFSNFNSYF